MTKRTFILVAAFGPLREALYRGSMALEDGRDVAFLCFRSDVFNIILPLGNERVEVIELVDSLSVSAKSFVSDAIRIRGYQKALLDRWGSVRHQEVWVYGTSISLPAILATTFFAKQNEVFYNPVYEGRGTAGSIFEDSSCHPIRKMKALALSALTGSYLEVRRDWSPAFVLSDKFVSQFQVAPPWDPSRRYALEDQVRQRCNTDILVLFTNYVDYYRTGEKDEQACEGLWLELGALLKASGKSIAVKPHPTCSRLPSSWDWMEVIPAGVPLELLDLSGVQLVLGDSSTAMNHLAANRIPTVSFVDLYETSWAAAIIEYMDVRVDSNKEIRRVANSDELRQVLTNDGRARCVCRSDQSGPA